MCSLILEKCKYFQNVCNFCLVTKKKVSTKSVAITTSAGISALECSDKSGRFGTQLEFFFFYQKSLLFPSLWLSATERHSLPPSPASVGEISFNIPALWGRGRRSSLIGWAEMLPVFKTRQIRGCYWCFCLQCRFWKALSASGRVRCRRFPWPPFWKMEDGLLVNVYASHFKCPEYCWCMCCLLAPAFKCGVCKIRCFWLNDCIIFQWTLSSKHFLTFIRKLYC